VWEQHAAIKFDDSASDKISTVEPAGKTFMTGERSRRDGLNETKGTASKAHGVLTCHNLACCKIAHKLMIDNN